MLTEPYASFHRDISSSVPRERILQDPLSALAYGTDASFYRLIPKLVVRVETEDEVRALLRAARAHRTPLTFRAAGTSLSGQAISDSVLVVLTRTWDHHVIHGDGERISLQPAVIGARANVLLAPYGKKIGPDPASINAAMIGGIAANNASGMCCGTAQNSYRTLASMRVILADGTTLDTADPRSREAFLRTRAELARGLAGLSSRVRSSGRLAERIREKYRMKNTMGYSLNALVDFEDPIEILQHLMIGSEGTLGFIAEITYHTVPEHPHKATSLMIFPDIATACAAVPVLKRCAVDAVELMDRASLRSVQDKPGMPSSLAELGPAASALLVETRAAAASTLQGQIQEIQHSLREIPTVRPLEFTSVPAEFTQLWNIRKGLFPSVGAMRESGTTVIIEDVAFRVDRLAEATLDLQALLRKYSYDEAIIFGHALEGNLHFVFTQDFNRPEEVERYRKFMEEVSSLVVRKYDGALKAEHGTGRNMAPFLSLEWGEEACALMREIKALFDPDNILNPGVILNDDPAAHVKDLKPLPAADPIVDKCIECGFCEVQCPSRNLTLTPRQRIVVYREIQRLTSEKRDAGTIERLATDFDYSGNQTCATDGLCALSCPVGIDTGKLVKEIRFRTHSPGADRIAGFIAGSMGATTAAARGALKAVHALHLILGPSLMGGASRLLRKISGNRIPLWNPFMPTGASTLRPRPSPDPARPTVVYFPTCINRTFGPSRGEEAEGSLHQVVVRLLEKAGYNVLYPPNLERLCCGMAFASKGFREQGDRKARELEGALLHASENGRFPVLTDMSPCLYRMKETFTGPLRIYEPVRFTEEYLTGRLTFRPVQEAVAVHTTCSAEKMGLAADLRRLAERCASRVVVPAGIGCCGWAGDRGFTYPELNASALQGLRGELQKDCVAGYSTSRTCEIGLSLHSGLHYRSILFLVDRCTTGR